MKKARVLEILNKETGIHKSADMTPLLAALRLYFSGLDGCEELVGGLAHHVVEAVNFFISDQSKDVAWLRRNYIEENIIEHVVRNKLVKFSGENTTEKQVREEHLRLYTKELQDTIPALCPNFSSEIERALFLGNIFRAIQKELNDSIYYAVELLKQPKHKDGH